MAKRFIQKEALGCVKYTVFYFWLGGRKDNGKI